VAIPKHSPRSRKDPPAKEGSSRDHPPWRACGAAFCRLLCLTRKHRGDREKVHRGGQPGPLPAPPAAQVISRPTLGLCVSSNSSRFFLNPMRPPDGIAPCRLRPSLSNRSWRHITRLFVLNATRLMSTVRRVLKSGPYKYGVLQGNPDRPYGPPNVAPQKI